MDRPWYEFQPKERAAAKKAGMKQYFTGRPCKQGMLLIVVQQTEHVTNVLALNKKRPLNTNYNKILIIIKRSMLIILNIIGRKLQTTEKIILMLLKSLIKNLFKPANPKKPL